MVLADEHNHLAAEVLHRAAPLIGVQRRGIKNRSVFAAVPHSTPLNVFTPKWRKKVRSSRIQSVWLARGKTFAAFSAMTAEESPSLITCSVA